MRKIISFFCVLFCFCGYSQTEENTELISSVIEKYKGHQNMLYDIEYMIKYFDRDEPFFVNTTVFEERIPWDSVFNGKFLYQRNDEYVNVHKFYDTDFLYVIDHKEEKITKYDAKNEQTYPVTGNVDGEVLDIYFLDIENLWYSILDKDVKKDYTDSLSYLKLKLSYPDGEDIYGQEKCIYFNKETKTIDKITFVARYKDQIQRNQWLIKNIVFDKQEDFLKKETENYFKNYTIEDYVPLTEEDYKLLENGKIAPEIKGKIFPDYQKEVTLKSDKILILDFWYTSCMPCIKTIPVLNQIQKEYGDYVQVIGINPIENEEKHIDKINAFLNRTPIDYPILLLDEIPEELNIRAYPTLYIIGEDGKVKFSEIGSSEDMHEILAEEIKKLIADER